MEMDQYIRRLGEITTVTTLREYFCEQAVSAFGAKYVAGYPLMYGNYAMRGTDNVYVSNFSPEVARFYWSRAAANDPFTEATIVQGGPVQYAIVKDKLRWDREQIEFFKFLPRVGLLDGVGSPVTIKSGVTAFFIMTFTEEQPEMGWSELRRHYVFFSEFFARYWELNAPERPMISLRERQILVGIMNGKSKTQISDQLGLSVHTVDTYIRRCFEKLEATSRTEAAIKAFGLGLAYSEDLVQDKKDD